MNNDKGIIAKLEFDVPIYIKMEYNFPLKCRGDLPRGVGPLNFSVTPFLAQPKGGGGTKNPYFNVL